MSGSLDSLRALQERLSGTAARHLLRAGSGSRGPWQVWGGAFSILQESPLWSSRVRPLA